MEMESSRGKKEFDYMGYCVLGILFCFSSFTLHWLNLPWSQEAEMQGDIIRVLLLQGTLHLACERKQEQTRNWVSAGCSVTCFLSARLPNNGCISLPKAADLIGQLFCSYSYFLWILVSIPALAMCVQGWQFPPTVASHGLLHHPFLVSLSPDHTLYSRFVKLS